MKFLNSAYKVTLVVFLLFSPIFCGVGGFVIGYSGKVWLLELEKSGAMYAVIVGLLMILMGLLGIISIIGFFGEKIDLLKKKPEVQSSSGIDDGNRWAR